jgi:hypothetical protein
MRIRRLRHKFAAGNGHAGGRMHPDAAMARNPPWIFALAAGIASVCASAADATSAAGDRVIAGGGGTSSSGALVLSGSIGQPLTTISAHGDVSLVSGFWKPLQPTPAGPRIFKDGFEQ